MSIFKIASGLRHLGERHGHGRTPPQCKGHGAFSSRSSTHRPQSAAVRLLHAASVSRRTLTELGADLCLRAVRIRGDGARAVLCTARAQCSAGSRGSTVGVLRRLAATVHRGAAANTLALIAVRAIRVGRGAAAVVQARAPAEHRTVLVLRTSQRCVLSGEAFAILTEETGLAVARLLARRLLSAAVASGDETHNESDPHQQTVRCAHDVQHATRLQARGQPILPFQQNP